MEAHIQKDPLEENGAAQGSSSALQLTGIEAELRNLSTSDSNVNAVPSTEIRINFDDCQDEPITAVDILLGLLIENKSSLVLLGERETSLFL